MALAGANLSVTNATMPAANESGVAANVSLDAARLNVTVRNTGPIAGNLTVNVTAANHLVATQPVDVDARSTRTVTVTVNVTGLQQEGPILVEATGVDAGRIPASVEAPNGTDNDAVTGPGATTTSGDSPFALATLLVVLGGAVLLARRD